MRSLGGIQSKANSIYNNKSIINVENFFTPNLLQNSASKINSNNLNKFKFKFKDSNSINGLK
jgi:hypothetical protein